MKKIIVICLMASLFVAVDCHAFYKPACASAADAYLTRSGGLGAVIVDYYNGLSFLCSSELSKKYVAVTIERKPYTQIIKENTEIYDEFTENLSSIISFFAGVLAMMGFILGIKGGRLG